MKNGQGDGRLNARSDNARLLFMVSSLSAATLALEGTLLRLLSIQQFYHFAFLVVSLALLGFGASGSLLSVSRHLRQEPVHRLLARCGLGFVASVAAAYLAANWLPFDSYSIAWDLRQIGYFGLYFLALSIPFVFTGLGIGAGLASQTVRSPIVYAANLFGAAVGALAGLIGLSFGGVPTALLLSALVGGLPFWISLRRPIQVGVYAVLVGGIVYLAAVNSGGAGVLGLNISPYKGLSYARQYPGSTHVYRSWSAISRLDVIAQAGTRTLPGLSYAASVSPPPQHGLAVDADVLQPVNLVPASEFDAAPFLPESIAFRLMPGAEVLVIEPGAGLSLHQALAGGANRIDVLSSDVNIAEAIGASVPFNPFASLTVKLQAEIPRSFLRRPGRAFDLVLLPLTDGFQPVTSGAYSLSEDHLLTVEAIEDSIRQLRPGGIFVATRWLQTPPSECLRLLATVISALERLGVPPASSIVAYRGIQTVTVLAQPSGWTAASLAEVRAFTASRKFDLVWVPDILPEEANRFNILPEPALYEAVQELLGAEARAEFYRRYNFDVAPRTDDRPFFFHFFKWQQTPEVLAVAGRVMQPFGGSGYFVLLGLLIFVFLVSGALILAPLRWLQPQSRSKTDNISRVQVLGYFTAIGLGFLFIEIPLIQRWILFTGQPIYAFSLVVVVLLTASGIGSSLVGRANWLQSVSLPLIVLVAVVYTWLLQRLTPELLSQPLWIRLFTSALLLFPLGVLLGFPFPSALSRLKERRPDLIPWAWAVNGSASVIAAVLAAIIALGNGYTVVMWLGAVCYALAWWMRFDRGEVIAAASP